MQWYSGAAVNTEKRFTKNDSLDLKTFSICMLVAALHSDTYQPTFNLKYVFLAWNTSIGAWWGVTKEKCHILKRWSVFIWYFNTLLLWYFSNYSIQAYFNNTSYTLQLKHLQGRNRSSFLLNFYNNLSLFAPFHRKVRVITSKKKLSFINHNCVGSTKENLEVFSHLR